MLLCAAAVVGSGTAAAEISQRGIWIGDLDLCRAGPVKAEAGADPASGLPIVSIKLSEALRDALAKLTRANVGKPLPIRVDGRIVSEPHVHEPLLNGDLQISGIDRSEADRIAAALQSCPAETPRTTG